MTYYSNGRCDGYGEAVTGYVAQPRNLSGSWRAQKISSRMFRMQWHLDDGTEADADFKVIDKDHIQNLDNNYGADRAE